MTPGNGIDVKEAAAEGFGGAELAMLRAVFDGVPGRSVLFDGDLILRMVNREFLDFVGGEASEVVGRSMAELVGPDLAERYAGCVPLLLGGEPIRWEGWADYGRFGRRYVQEVLTPYRPRPDGPVAGCIAIAGDITEFKLQEQELRDGAARQAESDALHKAVVDTSLDCIIIVDGEGRVVDFNPTAERLFGYSRAEALGREIGALIIPEAYRAAHYAGMSRYITGGRSRVIGTRVELEALARDGTLIPVELALADVSVGPQRFFTAHIRDLTQGKAAQREIERQREALHQKEKLAALGSLLSGVAHELNNPLSIVLGQAMMLREKVGAANLGPPMGPDLAQRALRIETAANRCARIVRSFLAMARQRKAERGSVSIARVIDDALELLSYSLRTSGVVLDRTVAADLPETHADADLIHQVVVNLLVNARQALEEKSGGQRTITLRAHHDSAADAIVITIGDDGPGIPPAIRSRIFDPFFTTKPQDHGTGIGLAVSRGLIEAHGGSLELTEPQPAAGAEFVVRLPVTVGEADDSTAGDAEPLLPKAIAQPRIVLIVDDEPDLAELIADMVGHLGYRATIAASGNAAQRLISTADEPIAAILCDIRMPDGDGPSLYDWLSAQRPELIGRIGFVTGDTLGPSAGRFLAKTGCPVIEKPFTPADIAAVLAALTA